MAGLSIPEFGPVGSPITNASSLLSIDAGWFVDFTELDDTIDIDFAALFNADTFTVSGAALSLWASNDPASIAQATLLATLGSTGTSGVFVGASTTVTVANPGGRKHLLLTSANGFG